MPARDDERDDTMLEWKKETKLARMWNDFIKIAIE
jgi:hypothetical protein